MEPVAIIGIGCRLPRAKDPNAYWRLLREGGDAITEVPPDRWDADLLYDPEPATPGKMSTRWGGFLDRADLFDPTFFGISGREAERMDPQQRLLLEVTWEALENAGIAADRLAGSPTGVFVGISNSDYARLLFRGVDVLDAYSATGTALSVAANRISYLLNLRGPSLAVDTACSSSLVAVHLACRSLHSGEAELCVAGGVNLILTPEGTITFSQARMMAPDGRCKAFDARADGYVRGEGCGMLVLKPLAAAERDGDRVLAVILGSAVNQDGLTNGLTAPNGPSQQTVIRKALANAEVAPAEISYVEAHGTGTSLGDPIEVRALKTVLMQGRSPDQPCWIGSVKTNVGHLESAAGVAGLLKLILALAHREIPPSLHFTELNPYINLQGTPISVATALTPWQIGGRRRIGGISAFGFGGTNCHMVLAEAPPAEIPQARIERPRHVLTLRAKAAPALVALASSYAGYLESHPDVPLADVCFTANTGRSKLTHRAAVAAGSRQQMGEQLRRLAARVEEDAESGFAVPKAAPKIVFLFTGQGSQFVGMGRSLYETQPTFRDALDRCDETLRDHLERPLLSVLYPEKGADSPLSETAYTQPALFALEYALAETWKSWGVRPSAAVGHSVGEYVAACTAGVFSLEDGLKLIATRARLMQELPQNGRMVAIFADGRTVAEVIEPYADVVSLAAVNGPRQVVISGLAEAVDAVVEKLKAEGFKTQPLAVSHAFHSPLMEPMLDAFEQVAGQVSFGPARFPLACNVTGQIATEEMASPGYWRRHVRQTVRFEEAIKTLGQKGFRLFLEVGPKPILCGLGSACLDGTEVVWLPSLRQGRDDWTVLLKTLGELFARGVDVDWRGFDKGCARRKVALPTYPFQRQRYWGVGDEMPAAGGEPASSARPAGESHPLVGRRQRSAGKEVVFETELRANRPAYLLDHQVFQMPVLPAAAYLEAAVAAARSHFGMDDVVVEDVIIRRVMPLEEDRAKLVQLVISPENDSAARFQVFSLDDRAKQDRPSWLLHASGKMAVAEDTAGPPAADLEALRARLTETAPPDSFYQTLRRLGLDYGPAFRGVRTLAFSEGEALGEVRLPDAVESEASRYALHPALLDAAFQVIASLLEPPASEGSVFLPVGVRGLTVYRPSPSRVFSHVQLGARASGGRSRVTAQMTLLAPDGEVVARVEDLLLTKVSPEDLEKQLHEDVAGWLYQVRWFEKPRIGSPAATTGGGASAWLVFSDAEGTGEALAAELRHYGQRCVVVAAGEDFSRLADDEYRIVPDRAEDYRRLLESVLAGGESPCRGIVHLWSLDCPRGISGGAVSPVEAQLFSCRSTLHLVQALAERELSAPPRLWLVTRGAQSVAEAGGLDNPVQSPLWGLARVIQSEHPRLGCTRIDLDPGADRGEVKALFGELWVPDRETEIAFRAGVRHAARLVRYQSPKSRGLDVPDEPYRLRLSQYGVLDNLVLRPMKRREPAAGQVEIAVRAAGLNFRDVLRALGMLKEYEQAIGIHSADDVTFGFECAGTVVAVGPGVADYHLGDEVIALCLASMASHVTVDTTYVAPKPARMSFEEAATVPLAYLTAYYGLCRLAGLKRGEKVLIHSAAGGVGQAAVALAQHVGAEVYATASRGKWDFLRRLGVKHIADSRSLDFADQFHRATGGRGVDVVLNALNGDYIPKSLGTLAEGGRFVEIGKIGTWSRDEMSDRRPDVAYYPFDLGEAEQDQPGLIASMLAELLEKFAKGTLRPLPHKTFDVREAVAAFRLMQQAKHLGKVVLAVEQPAAPEESPVSAGASYLITGGLGALGLEVARRLVLRGARRLVLAGRRAEPSKRAEPIIQELEAAGADVLLVSCDVTKADEVRRMIDTIRRDLPPLRGIVHAAGVLDDGVLVQQDWRRFRAVMGAKIDGAWHLHQSTRDVPLDFFVSYSSIAAVIGSPGQGNYAAANAFLDAFAYYLRAQGVPALTIHWGPWRGAGMAAGQDTARWAALGLETISPRAALAAQEQLLREDATSAGVFGVEWPKFLAQFPRRRRPPLLEPLAQEAEDHRKTTGAGKKLGVLKRLSAADAGRRAAILADFVTGQVAKTLGVPRSQLDVDQPLTQVGLDSLMGIELKNAIEGELDIEIPFDRFGVDTTVGDLATAAGELLGVPRQTARSAETLETPPAADKFASEPARKPAAEPRETAAQAPFERAEEESVETTDLFDKCERFFVQPAVIDGGERLLAADLFSSISPPRNAGPWIEAEGRKLLQFSSNDYLGLAMHEDVLARTREIVKEFGIASPMGSRLMTGTTEWHLELERKIAVFKRCEAAVAFPSGAMAMIGALACLGGPRDLLILDEHAHASLVVGAKASGAKIVFFRHNDLAHLESILQKVDDSTPRAVVVDGIYSMHGDTAPLAEMAALKNKYGARLIVDDAHGTGVLGEQGRGTAAHFGVEEQIDVHAGTFSKAVGTIGGFVAGDATVIEYIRYHAPTFVFSKSMPLAVVAATLVSLDLLRKADDRRKSLWENTRRVQQGLRAAGVDIGATESPITPIQLDGNEALHIADVLRKECGIWVAPVIYPAVPVGSSIIRLIPTALHTASDIDYLIESFGSARGVLAPGAGSRRETV